MDSITSGSKVAGSGKVTYSVAKNSKTSPRTASFTVARSVFTVNQDGENNSSSGSAKNYILKVIKKKVNNGSGSVKSYDRKIDCGEACSSSFTENSSITLYATPDQGSTFLRWAPASLGCEGTGPCTVFVDKAKSVKAIFVGDYELKLVNISKDGGRGRITSSPWALDCRTDNLGTCEATYHFSSEVTLSAYPSSDSVFVGWKPSTVCPGADNKCVVTMDQKRTIKALFKKREYN